VSPSRATLHFNNQVLPTHSGRAETLLFAEWPAGNSTLNTLSWFNVVFA